MAADTTAPDTTPADTGPADGSPCDDGRVCTQGDRWQGGSCTSGENVCECEPNQKGCGSNGDAVNLCKGPRSCVPAAEGADTPFVCAWKPANFKVCDSSLDSICTKNACAPLSGICSLTPVEAVVEVCDLPSTQDGGPACRLQSILPNEVASTSAVPCDDGISCSADDHCKLGQCHGDFSV